jgi:hypothetical protein
MGEKNIPMGLRRMNNVQLDISGDTVTIGAGC